MKHVGDFGRIHEIHIGNDGVAMEIECIPLGIFLAESPTRDKCAVAHFVIETIVAEQGALTGRIGQNHIAERFTILFLTVVIEGITGQSVSATGMNGGAFEKIGLSAVGIVGSG